MCPRFVTSGAWSSRKNGPPTIFLRAGTDVAAVFAFRYVASSRRSSSRVIHERVHDRVTKVCGAMFVAQEPIANELANSSKVAISRLSFALRRA